MQACNKENEVYIKSKKAYYKRITKIIRARLKRCESLDDFFEVLEFADDCAEDEFSELNVIRKEILSSIIVALKLYK